MIPCHALSCGHKWERRERRRDTARCEGGRCWQPTAAGSSLWGWAGSGSGMANSYRCTECGALLRNHAEMQAHAEDLGHQGFEEATEEIKIVYCCECGKDCRNTTAQQMHTRNTGHTQFQDTRPELCKKVETAGAAGSGGGEAGAVPMAVDDTTVGAQALGMLPGEEALKEPGDTEGQTKMVRVLDESGNMVAAVFKWAAKEQKWNKHKEIVDEDQPAAPEDIEKALATVNLELLGPLMEMGFAEERCKKALLVTGNDSVEHGIQWLTEHVEDPLADAPMTIAQVKKALKPKLTPEEKAAKAAELQRKAKAEREKREALEAIDREKRKRGANQPAATRAFSYRTAHTTYAVVCKLYSGPALCVTAWNSECRGGEEEHRAATADGGD